MVDERVEVEELLNDEEDEDVVAGLDEDVDAEVEDDEDVELGDDEEREDEDVADDEVVSAAALAWFSGLRM